MTSISSGMTINAYAVLSDAVERGVSDGYRRAHKHTDTPYLETLESEIHLAVMAAICEYFNFNEGESA